MRRPLTERQLLDLLENWDTLAASLQRENLILRAERDEARRALAEVTQAGSMRHIGQRPRRSRPRIVADTEVAQLGHLTIREAATILGVSVGTIGNARRRLAAAAAAGVSSFGV